MSGRELLAADAAVVIRVQPVERGTAIHEHPAIREALLHVAMHADHLVMEGTELLARDVTVAIGIEPREHVADVRDNFVARHRLVGHHPHLHPGSRARRGRGRSPGSNAWRRSDLGERRSNGNCESGDCATHQQFLHDLSLLHD